MSSKKLLKAKIIIGVLALILVLSIFCGGSAVINNYTPDGGDANTGEELKKITYNYDVLDEVTGGYSGPPKLVASDDKVFYIPQEYCDGSYLKNFRVIGINQSNAKISRDAQGNVTDYTGAVVLYGFQTTYREDYGKDYDFDYEPYDYNAEYNVVDSYFKDVVLGQGDSEKYGSSESENYTNSDEGTETTSISLYMPGSVETKKNEKAVDDSDFKVATVVMEHEIGKDECKILYCDADSCTVSDLDVGKYNLVTNLNDSALTVCYNEKIYVYSFNENESSYGSNEVYYYKLQDLFNSITFKNTLSDIGYCNVEYNVTGNVAFDTSEKGWVNVWTGKMSKKNTNTVKNVSYLSNLVGDTAKKDKINSDFIDMEKFVKDGIEKAYSGYKKEPSGWLSYKHSTSLENFGDYTYQKNGENSWTLKNSFKVNLEETSWLILFPKTYNGSATGNVTVNITPNFTLRSEYNYSINDLLLTKYGDDGENKKYSIIMQLIITPKNDSSEEATMEPITDFDEYVRDIQERAPYEDSTPEGIDEDELEKMDNEDYEESDTESEEYIEKEISAKYVTLNINLAQLNGTEKAEDIEVLSISNTAEIYDYFNKAKENYKKDYDNGISVFRTEAKSGPYVNPKEFTVESIKEFKEIFKEIKECCESLEKARGELESLNKELDSVNQNISVNINETNSIADNLTGNIAIDDKTISETGYYRGLDKKIEALANLYSYEASKIYVDNIYNSYYEFYNSVSSIVSNINNSGAFLLSINEIKDLNDMLEIVERNEREFTSDLNKLRQINLDTIIKGENTASLKFDSIEKISTSCSELYDKYVDTVNNCLYNSDKSDYIDILMESNLENISDRYENFNNDIEELLEFLLLLNDQNGRNIVDNYMERASLIQEQSEYQYSLIPEKEAEIAALEAKLDELKAKYDTTDFYVDLSWKGEKLDSNALVKYYTQYDEITAIADEYISAYNKLINVSEYKNSADIFINNIITLNTDENINRVIDNMYRAIPEEDGAEKYGTAYSSLVFLKESKNKFFGDISGAINNLAGIKTVEVEETTEEAVKEENINIKLIEDYVENFYGSLGINAVKKKTYSDVIKDCNNIYNSLYDSFSKVTIQEDGNDKVVCDITDEDVQNCVFNLFLDKYEIYELSDYNADGTVAKTYTLAKNQGSQGNVYEETEVSSETTTETYINSIDAVYVSYSSLKDYAVKLNSHYDGIKQIAIDKLLGSGCLTDEQQEAIGTDVDSIDSDITSDYNTGYQSALNIVSEMPELLEQAKTYYEVRQQAAGEITLAEGKGLSVEMRDDIYYTDIYKTKCEQADHLYRLLYNAAKSKNDDERNKYIDEYNSIDWIVDDLKVKDDLSSAIVVTRKTISTTYQKVDWNTSLIKADVESNASSTPYELYQMNSNFCIGISDNEGYIVPMGAQSDIDVKSVNAKIKEEIEKSGISEINNVAYGYNNGYDILLFSSDEKWFMIAFKQIEGAISVDIENVLGYSGKYSVGDEDPHFLEYDHTNVTGVNQLFSTTIENGYKPYSIELKNSRNGEIKAEKTEEENTENEGSTGAAKGVEGSFFNSWSDDKGNVILLGFKEEDMEIEEDASEITTETYYDGDTEITTEKKSRRKIADTDIYDAHLYVMQYETKAAEGQREDEGTSYFDTDGGKLFDAGIRLDGPYGELLEPAVNILTVALKAVLAVVYALAVLYCVYLGLKLSRASNDEERHKAKEHIKWFIIAVIGTHMLIAFIYLARTQLQQWDNEIQITSGYTIETTTEEDND